VKIFKQIDKAILGSVSALVFFVLGFIWWVFDYDFLVPMWVFSVVIILCYLVCIIIYAFFSVQKDSGVYRLPIIKSIQKSGGNIIFIIEKNELFNQGYYTSICYQSEEESFEVVLGLGYVQTINSAGYMQIIFEKVLDNEAVHNIIEKIDNSALYRKAIKIKPSIYRELIKEE